MEKGIKSGELMMLKIPLTQEAIKVVQKQLRSTHQIIHNGKLVEYPSYYIYGNYDPTKDRAFVAALNTNRLYGEADLYSVTMEEGRYNGQNLQSRRS